MDTPDNNRKVHASPSFLSKFEDSPVFNYISTLSPIKQFSFSQSAQSLQLLNFASPQSLQTPPPPNCLKESEIVSADNASDASMNKGSQNGCKGRSTDTTDAVQPCDLHNVKRDKFVATDEPSNLATELPLVKYEGVSPESNVECSRGVEPNCEFNLVETEKAPGKVIQDNPKDARSLPENNMGMQGMEVEDNKDVCEWEKFISDTSDILDCHSPTKETQHEELHDTNMDSGTLSFVTDVLQSPKENMEASHKLESLCPVNTSEYHGEARRANKTNQMSTFRGRAVLSEEVVHCVKTETNDKSSTQQQQTTRRRCLVYEMSGSHYRKLLSDSSGGSPILKSAVSTNTSNKKCLVANKPGSSKFSSLLPGIGLHLNALAASGKDKIIVKRENVTCRRQLLSVPRTMSSFNPLSSDLEGLNAPLASEVVERVCEVQKDNSHLNENVCENSASGESTAFPPSSPKKKRKKSEDFEEADSCKRCNCKRSKCLKLYCECFAAGLYCVEPCNCQDCFNKPAHEDIVLETRRQIESRNPLAFAPKVIVCSASPSSVNESNKTPASARHKRGCNCKKSGCLKKYCECFQGGVGCSLSCRCDGCKNTFGQKEGLEGLVFEESKNLKECAPDVSPHDDVSKTDHEIQLTPEISNDESQPVRRPFHFGDIVQQKPLLVCGQSLQPCTNQKADDADHTSMMEEQDIISNDETMEDLKGEYLLPTTTVKSTSPNCKRISSDQHEFETSPGWKSCRKLILRSIPSLSTIVNEQESTRLQGKLQ